jgi:hypothetical protein
MGAFIRRALQGGDPPEDEQVPLDGHGHGGRLADGQKPKQAEPVDFLHGPADLGPKPPQGPRRGVAVRLTMAVAVEFRHRDPKRHVRVGIPVKVNRQPSGQGGRRVRGPGEDRQRLGGKRPGLNLPLPDPAEEALPDADPQDGLPPSGRMPVSLTNRRRSSRISSARSGVVSSGGNHDSAMAASEFFAKISPLFY